MGFGLLVLGYMTVLSAVYIYVWYAVLIPVIGAFVIFAAFCKLQEYNIYFKISKYISILYVLVLIGLIPFYIMEQDIDYISKIIRILVLFVFHYFMLSGIHKLASGVDNQKISKNAKLNIYFTYIYFGTGIFGISGFGGIYFALLEFAMGLVYFFCNLLCIYRCFLQITYEGHDEN